MSQFVRFLLLSLTALGAFIVADSYISNSELAELRHSHIAKTYR